MVREVVYLALGQGFQICEILNYSLLELVRYDVIVLLEKLWRLSKSPEQAVKSLAAQIEVGG